KAAEVGDTADTGEAAADVKSGAACSQGIDRSIGKAAADLGPRAAVPSGESSDRRPRAGSSKAAAGVKIGSYKRQLVDGVGQAISHWPPVGAIPKSDVVHVRSVEWRRGLEPANEIVAAHIKINAVA